MSAPHDFKRQQPEQVPSIMGKYRLLTDLGHGGMAHVFLAIAQGPSGFSKLVVLKMLRRSLALDPDTVNMFLDEARLAGRLSHPNVVHTYEVGEEAGRYLLVMEYLEGQALSAILQRAKEKGSRFPLAMHLRVLIDALSGLHYAHELKDFGGRPINLVHRDVSPQNIFVTYDGHVKVLDFGIAKAVTSVNETKAGIPKGKVPYMAPEQFLGLPVNRRADIYSMGAVLWHAATGERLWKGTSDVEVIAKVSRGDIPSPSQLSPDVDKSLDRLCAKALSFDQANRYATAAELEQELEVVVEDLNARVTMREIGNYVAAAFEEDRVTLARTIESRTKKIGAADAGVDLGSFLVRPQPFGSGSFILTSLNYQASINQTETGPMQAPPPTSRRSPEAAAPPPTFSSSPTTTQPNQLALVAQPPAVFMQQRTNSILAIAAFGLSLAAAFFILRSTWSTPPGAPSAIQPQDNASSSQEHEVPRMPLANITVAVNPSAARVFFDDQERADNPVTITVPRDNAIHYVTAEAPGFVRRRVEVRAEGDTTFNLRLDRASVLASRAKDASSKPHATASAQPVEAEARPTPRPLDRNNPWETQ